jgi:dynactin-6
MEKAIVCSESKISGNVSFGKGTVVHPNASIHCPSGTLQIGKNNIIEENVIIRNK